MAKDPPLCSTRLTQLVSVSRKAWIAAKTPFLEPLCAPLVSAARSGKAVWQPETSDQSPAALAAPADLLCMLRLDAPFSVLSIRFFLLYPSAQCNESD